MHDTNACKINSNEIANSFQGVLVHKYFQLIFHSLVLQEQPQQKGSDDWYLITPDLMIGTEVSCPHLRRLSLCEHHVDEHLDKIWFGG